MVTGWLAYVHLKLVALADVLLPSTEHRDYGPVLRNEWTDLFQIWQGA